MGPLLPIAGDLNSQFTQIHYPLVVVRLPYATPSSTPIFLLCCLLTLYKLFQHWSAGWMIRSQLGLGHPTVLAMSPPFPLYQIQGFLSLDALRNYVVNQSCLVVFDFGH